MGEAFVNPHVRDVGGGDGVAEPFVGALVNDDEVELKADANAGEVAPEISVREPASVSAATHRTGMSDAV